MSYGSGACSVNVCREVVETLCKSSSRILELTTSIPGRPHISCQDCTKSSNDINSTSRAVIRDSFPLEIVLCCDRLSTGKIEEVLIHELIHAYDYSKNRCNFSTCTGLAYSEIRAAREAECRGGFYPFLFMRDICVREKAIKSTANLFSKSEATTCVNAVFSEAMSDLEPIFLKTPREG